MQLRAIFSVAAVMLRNKKIYEGLHILRAQLILSSFRQGSEPTRAELLACYARIGVSKRTAAKGIALLNRPLSLDGHRFCLAQIIDGRYHKLGISRLMVALGLDPNDRAYIQVDANDLRDIRVLDVTIAEAVGYANVDDDGSITISRDALKKLTGRLPQAQRRLERKRNITARENRAYIMNSDTGRRKLAIEQQKYQKRMRGDFMQIRNTYTFREQPASSKFRVTKPRKVDGVRADLVPRLDTQRSCRQTFLIQHTDPAVVFSALDKGIDVDIYLYEYPDQHTGVIFGMYFRLEAYVRYNKTEVLSVLNTERLYDLQARAIAASKR